MGSLIDRHGPSAPAPLTRVEEHELEELAVSVEEELEHESRDDVDGPAQVLEDEREARRRMFAGLGWSTTAPAPAAPLVHGVGPMGSRSLEAPAPVELEELAPLVTVEERPRCAGCPWLEAPGFCPGRGGACCSRDAQLRRLRRDGLASARELEELAGLEAAEVAPAPIIGPSVEELERMREERAAQVAGYQTERGHELAQERDEGPAPAGADVMPHNAVTGAEYRGGNILRLLAAELEHGYTSGAGWAGFRQWLTVGRVVRKGEHGTACLTVMSDKRESSSDAAPAQDASPRKGRGIRGFRVFHYDQTVEAGDAPAGPSTSAGAIDEERDQ